VNQSREQHKLFNVFFLQAICLFVFLFPLFFQLSGVIFTDEGATFNSEGNLLLIPLPIASVTCFIGIVALIRLEKNHFGVGFVFSVFMLMMLSTLVSTAAQGEMELAKYILLIQFLLPMFALVLGQLYLEPRTDYLKFEAIALYVLLIIIPFQMIATVMAGTGMLTPSLYIFSLYQHLQYLPEVFVSLYFLTVVTLFENKVLKYIIIFLAPWVGAYIAAALSIITILVAVVLGVISLIALVYRGQKVSASLLIVLLGVSFLSYYPSVEKNATYTQKYDLNTGMVGSGVYRLKLTKKDLTKEKVEKLITEYVQEIKIKEDKYSQYLIYRFLPANIKERLIYWDFYGKGVIESPKIFLFGHKDRPHRDLYPSAHNYYLDLIYHFGIISLLPFIYLISLLITKSFKVIADGKATSELFVLLAIVLFFIFIDNFLKVSSRQPYSGMVTFFLWGKLLSQLSKNSYVRLSR
jgi:hypothetical protein